MTNNKCIFIQLVGMIVFIRERLENLPSVCTRDSDGQLASWELTHSLGAVGYRKISTTPNHLMHFYESFESVVEYFVLKRVSVEDGGARTP